MLASDEKEYHRQHNICSLFKYTSIKEIFSKIVSQSEEIRAVKKNTSKNAQLIVVSSACGGVGKTEIAMGLAHSLTKQFKRVLYINASRLQTFQSMLDDSNPIAENDVYHNLAHPQQDLYTIIKAQLREQVFCYLPPFKMPLLSLGLPVSVFREIAISAQNSGDFDFIIVDLDSSFDEEMAQLFQCANRVVLLTTQTQKAVFSLNCLMGAVNNAKSEKYLFVCNRFDRLHFNALQDASLEKKFVVSEYIDDVPHAECAKIEDFAKMVGLKRVAMLIV